MAIFKPFKALRPAEKFAAEVLCPPYDVINSEQASKLAKSQARSFIHVTRADADMPEFDPYSEKVYDKSYEKLMSFINDGVFIEDTEACYYIYSETMSGRTQTGIVGCASIDDYDNDVIRKHEKTRKEKEIDRINHFDRCNADTEPIFLMHKQSPALDIIIDRITSAEKPIYEFSDNDSVIHKLWVVSDDVNINDIENIFSKMKALYIADGHHRAASAVYVGKNRRNLSASRNSNAEFNRFMAVSISGNLLSVLGYHRLISDLNGMEHDEFLSRLNEVCIIEPCEQLALPQEEHCISMYLQGNPYKLRFKEQLLPDSSDTIGSMDVSMLQNHILSPILNISDPRTDRRISFAGGIDCEQKIKSEVDNKNFAVAFLMYPVTVESIMRVADKGLVMPPKSTWFEPKLGSGWFVHKF